MTTCPPLDTLSALANGTLPDDELATIGQHLETCPSCCARVPQCEPDTFLGRLLVKHPSERTPFPEQSPAFSGWFSSDFSCSSGASAPESLATEPLATEPLPTVPGYRILRELGTGGMGQVYLAHHDAANRDYALKIMQPDFGIRPSFRERFLREIRAAVAIGHHPHIVAAYPPVVEENRLIHVMEYVAGQTLADVVQHNGPLPIATACAIIRQAASGLQQAFDHGVTHRDIKPQNLLVVQHKDQILVKVADFGLAKMADPECSTLTESGAILGTPDYMAPEQARNAAHADTRSDVYALGCTFYFLLTGRPPFPEGSATEKMLQHVLESPPALAAIRPELPPHIIAIVQKMMAKEPADRYPTPGDVVAALADETTTPRPTASPRPRRLAVGGVLGFLLIGTLMILNWSGALEIRTRHGTIVLRNLPAQAHVAVDGETVTVSSGARSVDIAVTADQPHRLVVQNNGVNVYSAESVTVAAGADPFVVELRDKTAPPAAVIPPAQTPPGTASKTAASTQTPADWLPLEQDGFQPLFDGESLKGWDLANPQTIKWTTKDGVIRGANHGYHPSRGGAIFTTRQDFHNFHFRCEVLAGQNRETWVWFRHNRTVEHGARRGYGVPNPSGEEISTRDGWGIGSLYEDVFQVGTQRVKPSVMLKPSIRAGEWYWLDILAREDVIQVYVNRQKSLEYTAPDPPARKGSFGFGCPILSNLAVRSIAVKEFPQ
ncbi:MAG: protein kinase [Bacteroidales bacterium]|nr:protein kinase [Bacteroidales bacterium]